MVAISTPNGGSVTVPLAFPVTQRDATDRRSPRPTSDWSSVSDLLQETVGRWPRACRPSITAARRLHHAWPVLATVPVGNLPYGVAANPLTSTVYVTNATSDTVSVLGS